MSWTRFSYHDHFQVQDASVREDQLPVRLFERRLQRRTGVHGRIAGTITASIERKCVTIIARSDTIAVEWRQSGAMLPAQLPVMVYGSGFMCGGF